LSPRESSRPCGKELKRPTATSAEPEKLFTEQTSKQNSNYSSKFKKHKYKKTKRKCN